MDTREVNVLWTSSFQCRAQQIMSDFSYKSHIPHAPKQSSCRYATLYAFALLSRLWPLKSPAASSPNYVVHKLHFGRVVPYRLVRGFGEASGDFH